MQLIFNILISFSLNVMLALSFVLIYQTSKFFNIAHAIIITLGAYFTYCFFIQFGFNFLVSVFITIFLSMSIGLILDRFLFCFLRKRNVQPFMIMIASLGVYIILQNLISLIWQDSALSFRNDKITVGNNILGAYVTNVGYSGLS